MRMTWGLWVRAVLTVILVLGPASATPGGYFDYRYDPQASEWQWEYDEDEDGDAWEDYYRDERLNIQGRVYEYQEDEGEWEWEYNPYARDDLGGPYSYYDEGAYGDWEYEYEPYNGGYEWEYDPQENYYTEDWYETDDAFSDWYDASRTRDR